MTNEIDQNQTDTQPKGITDAGTAPKRRIGDAEAARKLVTKVVEASKDRSRFNAKLQGMFDGHPPYSEAKLRNSGQAYRCNINFMEAEAALQSASVPYYDLFSGANEYVNIELRLDNVHDAIEKSQIVTEEFNETLKEWSEFDFSMHAMIQNFVAFGKGFFFWPDKRDWRYKQVHHMKVYVLDGTRSNPDDIELLVIRQELPAHIVWGYGKDPNNRKWDRQAIASACRRATATQSNVDDTADGVDYEKIAQQIKDRDLDYTSGGRMVKLAHIYVKEFDGKVSHYIVEEVNPETMQNRGKPRFMYSSENEYDHFCQAISTFFFETKEGSWNGATGLGRSIYSTMEIKNRLRCSAIDNTFARSGIVLQAKDAHALQETSLIQMGSLTVLPPGYDVQNAQIFTDIEGPLAVNRDLENMVASNTGIYRQRMDKPTGNPRTAEEVRLQFMSTAVLGNSAVNRFYLQLDRHYKEIYRRMILDQVGDSPSAKSAKEFQERCKKRGVTLAEMRKIRRVRATRAVGNGSQFMRQQAIAQLMPIYGQLPATGQQNMIRDIVSSTVGSSNADRYAPIRATDHTLIAEQNRAMVENGAFKDAVPVPVVPTDNHTIHADVHLSAVASGVQSLQQGSDMVDVVAFADAAMPHIAQHIQQIGEENKRKALEQGFQQLAKAIDDVRSQMQERQQANAEAQKIQAGQDPKVAIDQAKAQQDMQIKQAEHEQKMKQDAERHRQMMEYERQRMVNQQVQVQASQGAGNTQG